MLADARGAPACSASLRTQTRPATESVSGEEGLRPKSRLLAPIVGQRGDGDVVVSPYNCSAGEQYSRCSFLLSHSASPCKIRRRAQKPLVPPQHWSGLHPQLEGRETDSSLSDSCAIAVGIRSWTRARSRGSLTGVRTSLPPLIHAARAPTQGTALLQVIPHGGTF